MIMIFFFSINQGKKLYLFITISLHKNIHLVPQSLSGVWCDSSCHPEYRGDNSTDDPSTRIYILPVLGGIFIYIIYLFIGWEGGAYIRIAKSGGHMVVTKGCKFVKNTILRSRNLKFLRNFYGEISCSVLCFSMKVQ